MRLTANRTMALPPDAGSNQNFFWRLSLKRVAQGAAVLVVLVAVGTAFQMQKASMRASRASRDLTEYFEAEARRAAKEVAPSSSE